MWRMTLTYNGDTNVSNIDSLPQGFESMGYTIKANEKNNNIREFTEKLGFTETTRTWIKSKIAADGLDIIIECLIEYLNDFTWTTLIDGILNIDADSYSEDEFFLKLNVSDSSFNTKLNDRQENEIDYNSKYSIGGLETLGFTNDFTDLVLTGSDGAGGYETTTVKCVLLFELFTKLFQKITDYGHMLFKSTLFGRTDLSSNGFNVSYDYAVDGDLSLLLVSKGLLISGILPNANDSKVAGKTDLVLQFEQLFNDLDSKEPLGMAVEWESGLPYIIIERLSYFFKNKQYSFVLTKNEVSNISKTLIKKFFNNKISAKSPSISKDNTEGLSDYTGESSYTSPLESFNNSYELNSKYSISPADIERARKNPVSGRTTDKENFDTDEIIFFIDAYRDGAILKSRDNVEGFQDVSGVYGTAPLYTNLRIRPTANIERHKRWWGIGLQKNEGEYLKFQKSEGLSKVVSQETGSTVIITDNANILISNLNPLLTGYEYNMLINLSPERLIEFQEYPYHFLKFWDEINQQWAYGWKRKFSTNPVDGSDTNLQLWEPVDVTTLLGGYLEFMDSSKGNIEFMDSSKGEIELMAS